MSTKTLGQWTKSVLPDNFKQVSGQTQAIQQFLIEHLPEPINRQVCVINISPEEIVVAVASSQLANYLRLYGVEIQQQIQESFHLTQKLKIRTAPESLLKIESPPNPGKPLEVSDETVDALNRGAGWIEDENLKQSLESLANALKKN